MNPMETVVLKKQLDWLDQNISIQMEEIENQAKLNGVDPTVMRDMSGSWVMTPLLVAKSNVLLAKATLQ